MKLLKAAGWLSLLISAGATAQSPRIGAGTTAPRAALHVSAPDSGLLLLDNSNALGPGVSTGLSFKTGDWYTGRIRTYGTSVNTSSMGFFTFAFRDSSRLRERMTITDNGNVGIGTTSPNAGALLDLKSTNQAFLPPRMGYSQIQAISTPEAGMIVYDTSAKGLRLYNGTSWILLGQPTQTQGLSDPPGSFTANTTSNGTGYVLYSSTRALASGAVIAGGSYSGTLTMGSFSITSAGSNDGFLAKFDAQGTVLWLKSLGSTAYDGVRSIDADASGNFYVGGTFGGTVNFDLNGGSQTLVASGSSNGFYIKYDSTGTLQWRQKVGGSSGATITTIVTDGTYLYIGGGFTGTATFNTATSYTGNGYRDGFIAKYSMATGLPVTGCWVNQIAAASGGSFVDVNAITPYSGGLLMGGEFGGNVNFGNGPRTSGTNPTSPNNGDGFFVSYNAAGAVSNLFIIAPYTAGSNVGLNINDVKADSAGNLYIAGSFSNMVDFDPAPATYKQITPAGSYNGFVGKYSSTGTPLWVYQAGQNNYTDCAAIDLDAVGNVYIGGTSTSTTWHPAGANLSGMYAYVEKLVPTGAEQWIKTASSNMNIQGISLDASTNGRLIYGAVELQQGGVYIGFDGVKPATNGGLQFFRYSE